MNRILLAVGLLVGCSNATAFADESAPAAPKAACANCRASHGVWRASGPFMARGPARRATVGVARAGAAVVRGTARVVGRVGVAAVRVAVAPVRLAARVATAPFRLVAHRRAHGCGVLHGRRPWLFARLTFRPGCR